MTIYLTDFEENNESDEHSLGSCSAEVAAINASEKQKKKVRDAPADIVKPAKTQTLNKKTAPVKAIPQPKMTSATICHISTNGNVTDSIYELQKVPSQEQLRMRYSQERAASQDYQSLGSTHSQEGLKPTSSAFLSTNSLHRGGAFVNYPQRGSIQSLPDAALLTVNQPPPMRVGRVAPNDHALAIDLLVAELELNTDAPSVSDKRRSFPTTQGEVSIGSARRDSNQQANQSKLGVAKISVQRSSNSPAKMPQMGQSSTLGRGASLQQDKRSQKTLWTKWRKCCEMLQQPQQPQPALSPRKYSNPRANLGVDHQPGKTEPKQGGGHSAHVREIWQFQWSQQKVKTEDMKLRVCKASSKASGKNSALFECQPPLVPASIVNSKPGSSGNKQPANSANSSQNSGYYSASSLAGGSSSTLRRSRGDSVFNGKNNNSTSSRAPSIDVDDDGFYDNILTENRFSGVISEMDDTSLCSQNLPPSQKSAGARIGQLIRRIGGSSLSKPPVQSAASLVSLNKVANDTPMHPRPHAGLMKSNSLSNEPWRIHAMGKEASSAAESKSMGIGDRLKQSIFGVPKSGFRLNEDNGLIVVDLEN
uniref:Uncharacterized protein n=1 Tax=Ditylenchus dipsaci TaxID=166011 RepID=A0A915DHW9_9BILA